LKNMSLASNMASVDAKSKKRDADGNVIDPEDDADLQMVKQNPQMFSLFRLLSKQSSQIESRIGAVEAVTESHSAQINDIKSELASLQSKMAVARAPTPCTSNSSSRLVPQLVGNTRTRTKHKDADPSKIIWTNPDHEVYRKQMVEECGKMLFTYGFNAKSETPEIKIGAGNCGKSATITFLKGESDANKFFQVAKKDPYKFTRKDGTEITMKIFKDQSSVDRRSAQRAVDQHGIQIFIWKKNRI